LATQVVNRLLSNPALGFDSSVLVPLEVAQMGWLTEEADTPIAGVQISFTIGHRTANNNIT
jgi:hypothetical protein